MRSAFEDSDKYSISGKAGKGKESAYRVYSTPNQVSDGQGRKSTE